MPARRRPHKEAKRKRTRPSALVRHAPAAPLGPAGPARILSAPSTRFDASDWAVGPCWATRVDFVGSQAIFLSRRRSTGGLAMVSAVINEQRGIVNGGGNEWISPGELEAEARRLAGPSERAYGVPPEYILHRIRAGESAGGLLRRPHADFRAWQFLLNGLEAHVGWEPDFTTLVAQHARPQDLLSTRVLVYAMEFLDWWFAPEDSRDVRTLLEDVDRALEGLDDGGVLSGLLSARLPGGLDLLTDTHYIAAPWPLTDHGTQAVEQVIDKHFARLWPADAIARYRERLLQMGYLTQVAGQPRLSSLIFTAAWGLDAASGVQPAGHPFLRAILHKTVEHHILG